MIDRYFRDHPRSVGETYFQHLQTAGGFGGQLGMFYAEADVGLDWGMPSFRTELSVGVVFEGGSGSRWQRHRPTRSLE